MTPEDRAALRGQLVLHEGIRLYPYRCPAGRLTIGVGRNIQDRGITKVEALILLDNDIDLCDRQLRQTFPWFADLDVVRQRALIDLCFNMGMPTLLGFKTAISAMRRGDYDAAADAFKASLWYKQVGTRGPRVVAMIREGKEA